MPVRGTTEAARSQAGTRKEITFYLNGEKQTVSSEYPPESTLADYIRYVAGVRGVKIMCHEGGCGVCSVAVTKYSYLTEKQETRTIKSCLCPLFSVDGWHITTTEGIGNKKSGFHAIQKRIASFNGSQCGYCTPGFVMNAYGQLNSNPKPNQYEIEASLDGNICRCTGYRPILDAMKSFASDSSAEGGGCIDIEDLKFCPRTGKTCAEGGATIATDIASDHPDLVIAEYRHGNRLWYKPRNLEKLLKLLKDNKNSDVFFGNTGRGIFKDQPRAPVQIDLQNVTELYHCDVDKSVITFGSNLTLNTLIDKMNKLKTRPGFSYFENAIQHLKRVASNQIRNSGTWAGNLMLKYNHKDFPSDVFIVFEAAGAKLEVADAVARIAKCKTLVSCEDLVRKVNMNGKVITAVKFHSFEAKEVLRIYKVSQRHQLAHAYANAGFRAVYDAKDNRILGKPTIVIGGLGEKQIHMKNTEDMLGGKQLTEASFKGVLAILSAELDPVDEIFVKKNYKLHLAVSFLYKFILELTNSIVAKSIKSGAFPIERPLSKGEQTYQEKTEEWPLKEPLVKQESYIQAAGEAQYTDDIPKQRRELQGAFVLSTVANAEIASVDPTEALKIPGVVRYITASDIPEGVPNALIPQPDPFGLVAAKIFTSDVISYSGEPIGLILAENNETAKLAASKVKVTYKNIKKPVLSVEESIAAKKTMDSSILPPIKPIVVGNAEEKMKKAKHVVEGILDQKGAYHFYMENQVCLTIPKESAYEIHVANQGTIYVQICASHVLQVPAKDVHVIINRVGGSFGGKFMSTLPTVAGSALGAYLTERPVRIVVPLHQNIEMAGGRYPFYAKYKVGFNDDGKVEALDADIYLESGYQVSGLDVFTLLTFPLGIDGEETKNRFNILDMPCQSSNLSVLTAYSSCMNEEKETKLMKYNADKQVQGREVSDEPIIGYHITDANLRRHVALTNTSTNIPMRSPENVPCTFFIESVLEHVAYALKKHPVLVKEKNLIQEGQVTLTGKPLIYCSLPRIWDEIRRKADVTERLKEVDTFNQATKWKKRAITMTPIKYHLNPHFNKFTSNVSIYQLDGTVNISTGGVEMGQGLNTKVAQAAAWSLGIPVDVIRVLPNDSFTNPNNMITGGSVGSEGAVQSMLNCCETLRHRIEPIKKKHPDDNWPDLIKKCAANGIDLTCKQTYHGSTDDYYVFGVSVVECELDVLTGESQLRRVDMLYDCGESLNPKIDIGQIEGAFLMGVGHVLQESVIRDPKTGQMLSNGTWEYKPPLTRDVPVDWRVHLLTDAPNPVGVKGSKASGEPSILMATAVLMALRSAIATAREDLTGKREFSRVEIPLSIQNAGLQCGVTVDKLTMKDERKLDSSHL